MKNSELRQNLVSGDWILFAPRRGKKPHSFLKRNKRLKAPIKNCPFENVLETHNPIFAEEDLGHWQIAVVENKYPAVSHSNVCALPSKIGYYSFMPGVGHHELVVTRDHNRNFTRLSSKRANRLFRIFRERYLSLLSDSCLRYISIFHNWGPGAGATIYHPHYQILAIPVVPPNVKASLFGSLRYFKKNKRCVHCDIIKQEAKTRTRIIYENKGAVVFTSFAAKEPFTFSIFPKRHEPYFEMTSDEGLTLVVQALQFSLKKMEKSLKDPDYNFFFHTAPVKSKRKYRYYHWHIEVVPKTNISAGFELSTGIEINIVDPDAAAKILRRHA